MRREDLEYDSIGANSGQKVRGKVLLVSNFEQKEHYFFLFEISSSLTLPSGPSEEIRGSPLTKSYW